MTFNGNFMLAELGLYLIQGHIQLELPSLKDFCKPALLDAFFKELPVI